MSEFISKSEQDTIAFAKDFAKDFIMGVLNKWEDRIKMGTYEIPNRFERFKNLESDNLILEVLIIEELDDLELSLADYLEDVDVYNRNKINFAKL